MHLFLDVVETLQVIFVIYWLSDATQMYIQLLLFLKLFCKIHFILKCKSFWSCKMSNKCSRWASHSIYRTSSTVTEMTLVISRFSFKQLNTRLISGRFCQKRLKKTLVFGKTSVILSFSLLKSYPTNPKMSFKFTDKILQSNSRQSILNII